MTVMMTDVIEDGDDLPIARVLSPDLAMRARLVERIEAIDEWLIDAYALGMMQSPSAAQAQACATPSKRFSVGRPPSVRNVTGIITGVGTTSPTARPLQ